MTWFRDVISSRPVGRSSAILACHSQAKPQSNDRSAALKNKPTHYVVVFTVLRRLFGVASTEHYRT